jgi:hypothetical protein
MNLNLDVPAGVFWTSILLFFLGSMTLVGSLLRPRDVKSLAIAMGSILLITTAVSILRNHRWALSFAFTSASLLTIGLAYDALHHVPFTWQGVGRFILLAALYWTACLWYRKWRRTEDKAVV